MDILSELVSPALPSNGSLKLRDLANPGREGYDRHGFVFIRNAGCRENVLYRDFFIRAHKLSQWLQSMGYQAGQKAIISFDDSEEHLVAMWACFISRITAVPFDPILNYQSVNNETSRLLNVIGILEDPLVLTSSRLTSEFAQIPGLNALDISVVGIDDYQHHADGAVVTGEYDEESLALMLTTSGSTGVPKLVAHIYSALLEVTMAQAHYVSMNENDVTLNWLSLSHVGGFMLAHLRDVYLGCTQIQVATTLILQNPLSLLDMVSSLGVTCTWAPNFIFNLLLTYISDSSDLRGWELSSLKHFICAGEMIVHDQLAAFYNVLKDCGFQENVIRPCWGMSEIGSIGTYKSDLHLAASETKVYSGLGRPLPGLAIRVVSDYEKGHNGIGEIQIKGSFVTRQYYRNDEANQQYFTPDGWLITGDIGMIADNELVLTGRKKDTIIINGQLFFAHEIETVINQELSYLRPGYTVALPYRAQSDSVTDGLAIVFCRFNDDVSFEKIKKDIRRVVRSYFNVVPELVMEFRTDEYPTTSIGKIKRGDIIAKLHSRKVHA